jgi:phage/conjugal plasmid C-4 type zinc finger TraR family protein
MKGLETLLNPDEHMSEDDKGLHAEQFTTDLALLQHRQAHAIDPDAVSAEWCDECGIEIPELRRQALPGVRTCIDCAREAELKDRSHR